MVEEEYGLQKKKILDRPSLRQFPRAHYCESIGLDVQNENLLN